MARATFEGVKITGLACAVPKNIEYIRDYADKFNVDKFIKSVGVEQRRVANEWQRASDFCYVASERLISYKRYDKASFDGIIYVTERPDYVAPATAHLLHKRIGLSTECMAFDVNLGCSGFTYGAIIAASLIKSGMLKRILLCCGELLAHDSLIPQDDSSISMMFGDSGCAAIVENGDDTIRTILKADGNGYNVLITPGLHGRIRVDYNNIDYGRICAKMDGPATFEFAIKKEPESVREYLDFYNETMDDYDYCVFHQANRFILEHTRRKLHLPKEKMPISIDRYGNTSSVSIPLTIADMSQYLTKDVNRFITSGFGAGLSWGVVGFSMEKRDILPIITTDDHFRDAYSG